MPQWMGYRLMPWKQYILNLALISHLCFWWDILIQKRIDLFVAGTKLEVCIDSLESARNAVNGGADELEVCSTLNEGGLTPSPGLVKEILELV